MKKFDKILEGLKNKSPLPLLFENGDTPETIKSEILNDFSRYFTDSKSLEIAGPGFFSMTRLAHENPILRSDIIKYNKSIIQKYLLLLIKEIKKIS